MAHMAAGTAKSNTLQPPGKQCRLLGASQHHTSRVLPAVQCVRDLPAHEWSRGEGRHANHEGQESELQTGPREVGDGLPVNRDIRAEWV